MKLTYQQVLAAVKVIDERDREKLHDWLTVNIVADDVNDLVNTTDVIELLRELDRRRIDSERHSETMIPMDVFFQRLREKYL